MTTYRLEIFFEADDDKEAIDNRDSMDGAIAGGRLGDLDEMTANPTTYSYKRSVVRTEAATVPA